mmetsp:Transcript_1438/g.1967  ORF Transcript_1438/g.1967 Transcript_1438/m.1967 type:complete len:119 (+) Transcript_1438:84-440(+)
MARITQRLIPPTFLVNDRQLDFVVEDEIFKLSEPKARDENIALSCKVCHLSISKKQRAYCDYCGKPMHIFHSRKRQFFRKPGDRQKSTIDLICLKKFQVKKMVHDAEKEIAERRKVLD